MAQFEPKSLAQNEPLSVLLSGRKWHNLGRNAWHYITEMGGTKRTEVSTQQPGPIVIGIPTAHSAPPLKDIISSGENYVCPFGKGTVRGQSVTTLYSSVTKAVQNDLKLYELLVLIEALRVGRAREKEIAIKELRARILDGE